MPDNATLLLLLACVVGFAIGLVALFQNLRDREQARMRLTRVNRALSVAIVAQLADVDAAIGRILAHDELAQRDSSSALTALAACLNELRALPSPPLFGLAENESLFDHDAMTALHAMSQAIARLERGHRPSSEQRASMSPAIAAHLLGALVHDARAARSAMPAAIAALRRFDGGAGALPLAEAKAWLSAQRFDTAPGRETLWRAPDET